MDIYKQWKQVFSEKFSKPFWKHFVKIFLSIEAVNQNIKPGFLWDIGTAVDPNAVAHVIEKLKHLNLLQSDIHVLCCAQECFIISTKHVLENAKEMKRAQSTYFVDVRENLNAPTIIVPGSLVHQSIEKMLMEVVKKIEMLLSTTEHCPNGSSVLVLNVDCDWCLPTLAGVLLGYPVVYWNGSNSDSEGTCLGFTSLLVYKITARVQSLSHCPPHEIYAFSIPNMMLPNLKLPMEMWYQQILNLFDKQNLFDDLCMHIQKESFPTVVI